MLCSPQGELPYVTIQPRYSIIGYIPYAVAFPTDSFISMLLPAFPGPDLWLGYSLFHIHSPNTCYDLGTVLGAAKYKVLDLKPFRV